MTCGSVHQAHCPSCGAHVWVGPSADDYPAVRRRIIAEGGIGRIHRCEQTVAEIAATYVRPRPIELGPVVDEIDWLSQVGRTPSQVRRR